MERFERMTPRASRLTGRAIRRDRVTPIRGERRSGWCARLTRSASPARRGCCGSYRDDDLPSRMSVLEVPNGGRSVAQQESAVDHRPHLSSFAEFLQRQQVDLAGLHEYASKLLPAHRKPWSEQQRLGQLAIRAASHRVAAV